MKPISLPVLVFCLTLMVLPGAGFESPDHKEIKPRPAAIANGFALVELFTSEGCSSCPPADEAVAALAVKYPSGVYVLAFHVDYWNYLGWKDAFSSAAWSERQQKYAGVFQLSSIYTPQIVVNGHTEFTGSDKARLDAAVAEGLHADNQGHIQLSAVHGNGQTVHVSFVSATDNKTQLQAALVQLHAASEVKRGENKGKQLTHIDVVRDFATASGKNGTVDLKLPPDLQAKDVRVIAFLQDRNNLRISAAASCIIN
jgi:hypothetical protein